MQFIPLIKNIDSAAQINWIHDITSYVMYLGKLLNLSCLVFMLITIVLLHNAARIIEWNNI